MDSFSKRGIFLFFCFQFLFFFLIFILFFTNRNTSPFGFYFLFHVIVSSFCLGTTRAEHAAICALILFKGNTYSRKARHIMW